MGVDVDVPRESVGTDTLTEATVEGLLQTALSNVRPAPREEVVFDIWTCDVCGTEYPFPRLEAGKRGGPRTRGLDRRYGFIYSCWRNKKCSSHKRKLVFERIILLSPAAPNPVQPDQDPELIARLLPRRRTKKENTQ